jgi:hypothetical protein
MQIGTEPGFKFGYSSLVTLARISHKARQRICSAGLLAGCNVGLPTHAGHRLLRHCVCKRYIRTRLCSGGEDAASTADQEVGATERRSEGEFPHRDDERAGLRRECFKEAEPGQIISKSETPRRSR